MKSGIYKVQNKLNGKMYIGGSVNVDKRLRGHKSDLIKRKHHSLILQRAWDKYGEENFVFEKILICKKQDILFYEQLITDFYKANDGVSGYNVRKVSDSNYGVVPKHKIKYSPGEKYGKLTLIKNVSSNVIGHEQWLCACECGREKILKAYYVKKGFTTSCGCLIKKISGDRFKTHGYCGTKEHSVWLNVIGRVKAQAQDCYKNIEVCDKWKDFIGFYEDMGDCPEGFVLFRKNVNEGYHKENCDWVSRAHQMRNNKRSKQVYFLNGLTNIRDVELELGIPKSSISAKVYDSKYTHQQAADHFFDKHLNKQLSTISKCRDILTATYDKIAA